MTHRNDEAYAAGYKEGKGGFIFTDVCQSLSKGLPSIDRDAESAYDKGYSKGAEDRPGIESWFSSSDTKSSESSSGGGFFESLFGGSDDKSDESSSGSGCFVTTACIRSMGRTDDCEELSWLRHYRDTYLAFHDEGRRAIQHYYEIAPRIVAAIEQSPNADSAFREIYERIVRPTVQMIKQGQDEPAFHHYRTEVERLAKLYSA